MQYQTQPPTIFQATFPHAILNNSHKNESTSTMVVSGSFPLALVKKKLKLLRHDSNSLKTWNRFPFFCLVVIAVTAMSCKYIVYAWCSSSNIILKVLLGFEDLSLWKTWASFQFFYLSHMIESITLFEDGLRLS